MSIKSYFQNEEKIENEKSHKKWLGFLIYLVLLVLSSFMYYKTEVLLTSFVFLCLSWVMLFIGFGVFLFKDKIKGYFHKNMYATREYTILFNNYFSSLTDKEKAKDKGIEKPLRDLLFTLKLYPILIAIFFLLELVMNRLGYNIIIAPGAVLFYTLQIYCTVKILKDLFIQWTVYKVFKAGELEL